MIINKAAILKKLIVKSPDFAIVLYPFLVFWILKTVVPIKEVSNSVFLLTLSIAVLYLAHRIFKRGDVQIGNNKIYMSHNYIQFFILLLFLVLLGGGCLIAFVSLFI